MTGVPLEGAGMLDDLKCVCVCERVCVLGRLSVCLRVRDRFVICVFFCLRAFVPT